MYVHVHSIQIKIICILELYLTTWETVLLRSNVTMQLYHNYNYYQIERQFNSVDVQSINVYRIMMKMKMR